jgi:hypothetical protein
MFDANAYPYIYRIVKHSIPSDFPDYLPRSAERIFWIFLSDTAYGQVNTYPLHVNFVKEPICVVN